MKNIFRKTYRGVILLGTIAFFGLNLFLPVFRVDANNTFGSGDNCINTGIDVQNGQENLFEIKSVTVDGNNLDTEAQYCTTGESHTFVITVTKKSESFARIGWGGNWNNKATLVSTSNVGNDYTYTINIVTPDDDNNNYVSLWVEAEQSQPINNNDNDNNNQVQPGPDNHEEDRVEFTGKAWFYWNCDGKVCKYLADVPNAAVDGTHGVSDDNPYKINYVKESIVKDSNTSKKLELSSLREGDYFWTWQYDEFIERLEKRRDWEGNKLFSTDQINKIKAMYDEIEDGYNAGTLTWKTFQKFVDDLEKIHDDAKRAFAIDPCGSRDGNNSLSTNGDRNFRATIYDDSKYMGLVFGVSRQDYTYFLPEWDPVFFSSEFDISGTTVLDPAVYDVYLLENNLKFELSPRISSNVVSIKPININQNAISITKDNDEYTVVFKSNYYDKVEFEVTDTNGKKYYFQLNRIVLNAYDRFTEDGPVLNAEFYYPNDNGEEDIKNYELIVTYVYKDGTSKMESIENNGVYRDANMDGIPVLQKTWQADKGLAGAGFEVKVDKNIKDVYVNVVRKGAFSDKSYGGTFAGSGLGLQYDSNRLEQVINDYYNRGGNR